MTLSTYLKQNFVKEIIIVDDNSSINVKAVLKDYNKKILIKIVRNKTRRGSAYSKNIGMKYATQKYILFGEDDVYLSKNYTSQLLNCLEKNNADFIAGRLIYKYGRETKNNEKIIRNNIIHYFTLEGNFSLKTSSDIQVPFLYAIFLCKSAIIKNIKFDTNYLTNGYREETDPQIYAWKKNKKIFFCPHTKCYHLQVNNKGGQHSFNRFIYEYWVIRNNFYFLTKYNNFLSKKIPNFKNKYFMILKFSFFRLINNIKLFLKSLKKQRYRI
jgi:GT2 family glycosyltransferase